MSPNSNRPRVLMTTARYLPFMGGTESHVYEVGRRLAQEKVDLTVLTTDPTGKLPSSEFSDEMHIRRVPAYPARHDYYLAPGVYSEITHGIWGIVHIQGIHTLVAPLAMFAARRAHIPYVVTLHTGGHSSRLRHAMRSFQWRALKPLLAGAKRIIGVSQFEALLFQKQLGLDSERFVVIPNGGHLPEPVRIDGQQHENLILSVGRLERYKGHHRVIAALPRVLEEIPDARLLIVGAGPYEADLRNQAWEAGVSDRVDIRSIPAGERQEMATLLSQAQLVMLMSEYEAHPVAVMEALALNRSVLVAHTSGLGELADKGLVRSIPLTTSPTEVAAAMVGQLRKPFSPVNVQLPTWDDCADQVLSVYSSVLETSLCAS